MSGFRLHRDGVEFDVPMSCQRVLAFLALKRGAPLRVFLAGMLWPDGSEAHARASLRSALWRIQQFDPTLVVPSRDTVALSRLVRVDVRDFESQARAVIAGTHPLDGSGLLDDFLETELLPGWYEDWVLVEREQVRQLRLHALEALSIQLGDRQRFAEAVDAAIAAVAGEPLRESAHRVLVRTYLSEGNPGEALRQYESYRSYLHEQLGVEPSPQMEALIQPLRERRQRQTGGESTKYAQVRTVS